LQNWGGIPHPKGMIAEKLPEVRYLAEIPSRDRKQEEKLYIKSSVFYKERYQYTELVLYVDPEPIKISRK
jgi:hypothetical protein